MTHYYGGKKLLREQEVGSSNLPAPTTNTIAATGYSNAKPGRSRVFS